MQNGFIERFNGSSRRGVLDMYLFRNLREVREKAEAWIADYSQQLPNDSLGGLEPAEVRQQNTPGNSSYQWN